MKNLFTGKRGEKRENLFTPDFFKFLLGFSIIIIFGFVVLAVIEANGTGLDGQSALWYYLS